MKARKGKFKVEFLDGEYEGYVLDGAGDTWNGHPCPFLTYEARTKLLNDLQAWKVETIDTEDGELILFPVGSQQLKWEEVKDD